jgi:(1->4)-alpha-D-glucan 1-alpha-D-glucosylmutase
VIATYRLQLGSGFGFDQARELVPYFAELGISHLYLSPITQAVAGSTHGYDVVDHNRISDELGGEQAFEALRVRCVEAGLGIVIDFVPNHAAVESANEAWQDLLAHGARSEHAETFDLDPSTRKILLPFLGRYYGDALDAGEISIVRENGRLFAAYFDHRFALRPESEALVESGATVHDVLEAQHWRLTFWKNAGARMSYRRFFDINGLVALRMESPAVFERIHTLMARLLREEGIDGLRIDHVDGLYDPGAYLARVRALGAKHLWVEKILAPRELLPPWPVDGTTGYESMNDIVRVLVAPSGEAPLTRTWHRFGASAVAWEEHVHTGKRLAMQTALAGELARLSAELHAIAEADYHTRDFTEPVLREAIGEVIAALARYRTYLPDDPEGERALSDAVTLADHRNPSIDPAIFDFLRRAAFGPLREDLEPRRRRFIGRLQQYAAPIAAKGVEDTALYRYHRAIALNEVGGDPAQFSMDANAFHARARHRAQNYPRGLIATATHDHKHGEDTRMRLAVLSELHRPWSMLAKRLDRLGAKHRTPIGPSSADVYMLHQIAIALWKAPDLRERLGAYAQKSAREAKQYTSWLHPDEAYEQALASYVDRLFEDEAFAREIEPLAARVASLGFVHTITQTVLKHTLPGIPDLYQGTELFDLSLVDPDNRRPVDYELRRARLREMRSLLAAPDLDALRRAIAGADERLKLYVHARLLALRKSHAELFDADHSGLRCDRHTLAFARGDALFVIVPRLVSRDRTGHVRGIRAGRYRDALTDAIVLVKGPLDLAALPLPWAVLVAERDEPARD